MIAVFAKSIKPDDLIAWMLIKDLTDHRIEIARYRRLKVAAFQRAARADISQYVSRCQSRISDKQRSLNASAKTQKAEFAKTTSNAEEIKKKYAEIDAEIQAAIAKAEADEQPSVDALKAYKMTDDEFVEITSRNGIASLERLDALLRSAEERFAATTYEIDRHQSGLGARFREQLEEEERKVIDHVSDGVVVRPSASMKADKPGSALSDRRSLRSRRKSGAVR